MQSTLFPTRLALGVSLVLSLAGPVAGADPVYAKDGSGVYGYRDTPLLPWCGFHVHDPDRPVPRRITPAPIPDPPAGTTAPSDAIILFDGKDLSAWQPSTWILADGCIEATVGDLKSNASFGNLQIHLEWRTPNPPQGKPTERGNSGVFPMGLYEIQIFESYTEKIYPDGQAAAIYGQTPPLVNACRPPGEWQSFDILFTAPVFEGERLVRPARVTVLHNGVIVHWDEEIRGETGHRILPQYSTKISSGPLVLQAHRNPVRFRNIWIRPW